MNATANLQSGVLDEALADVLDLSLLVKQAQWNVVGPRSQVVRSLLQDLADFACDSAQLIAERSAILGHSPDLRATSIATRSTLPTIEPGLLTDETTITAVLRVLEAAIMRIRGATDAFERDDVTVHLFTHMLTAMEKFEWVLRALRCST